MGRAFAGVLCAMYVSRLDARNRAQCNAAMTIECPSSTPASRWGKDLTLSESMKAKLAHTKCHLGVSKEVALMKCRREADFLEDHRLRKPGACRWPAFPLCRSFG